MTDYDDEFNPCAYCGHDPCACDQIFDSYKDREFDEY